MPDIKFPDRNYLPRAMTALAAGAARWLQLAFARTEDLPFIATRAFFAIRDRVAALRDCLPSRRDVAASTALAYGAVAIMSAILIKDMLGPTPANSSVASTPDRRSDWVDIVRPHAAFALESPALDGLEPRYDVRRHRSGGGRKDVLTFGHPETRGAYVRLSLYRPGAEGMAEPDPFEAVVALAAESGIDAELQTTSGKVRTKFGDLPAVNMRVQGKDGWRNCLAVAGGWNHPRFGLVAWWCNPGPEMVALGEFACMLDRTALMSAGGDDQLAEFFARAELKRLYCGGQGSFVSPTPRLVSDWIHAKRGPELRGKLSAR